MTGIPRRLKKASPLVLTSIEVPNEMQDLISVSAIGGVSITDSGVVLTYSDGDLLSWIECEDDDKKSALAKEFKRLVLSRDNEEYYKPDFSFMYAKRLTDESGRDDHNDNDNEDGALDVDESSEVL